MEMFETVEFFVFLINNLFFTVIELGIFNNY